MESKKPKKKTSSVYPSSTLLKKSVTKSSATKSEEETRKTRKTKIPSYATTSKTIHSTKLWSNAADADSNLESSVKKKERKTVKKAKSSKDDSITKSPKRRTKSPKSSTTVPKPKEKSLKKPEQRLRSPATPTHEKKSIENLTLPSSHFEMNSPEPPIPSSKSPGGMTSMLFGQETSPSLTKLNWTAKYVPPSYVPPPAALRSQYDRGLRGGVSGGIPSGLPSGL